MARLALRHDHQFPTIIHINNFVTENLGLATTKTAEKMNPIVNPKIRKRNLFYKAKRHI